MPQGKRGSEIDALAVEYSNQVVDQEADRQGVPREFARRIAGIESADRADVITGARRSSAGAIGKMQLMPGTAKDLGVDPYNIDQNIAGGVKYLGQQLKSFGGDQRLAAAAYNAGPGNVRKYKGVPPFAETQKYAANFGGGAESDIDKLAREFQGQSAPAAPKPARPTAQPLQRPDTNPFSVTAPTGFQSAVQGASQATQQIGQSADYKQRADAQANAPGVLRSVAGRVGRGLTTLADAPAGLIKGLDAITTPPDWAYPAGAKRPVVGAPGPFESAAKPVTDTIAQGQKKVKEAIPVNELDDSFWTAKLPEAVGSGIGFMAGGGAGRALGLGARAVPALLGAGTNVEQVAQQFDQAGGDPNKRDRALLTAAGTGALEAFGVGGKAARAAQGAVKQPLKAIGKEALEEGAQEYGSEYLGDVNARLIGQYDKNRSLSPVSANKLEAAALGGIVGGGFQAVGSLAGKGQQEAEAAPPPPPTPPPILRRTPLRRIYTQPETAPLSPVLPLPPLNRRRAVLQEKTQPLTNPFPAAVPDAPATTQMPQGASVGAEPTRTPQGAAIGAETTRTTAPEQARVTAEDAPTAEIADTPQQKRNRLITANKQRADAAAESYRKAFEQGDYEAAERSLRERKRYLGDIKSQIGNKAKTPGDSAVRARIDGELGAIGNRLGEIRRARRGAIKQGNQPTEDISAPLGEITPETTRVPTAEPIQDTTIMPPSKPIPETQRVTGEQDLPTRDLTPAELQAPTERELPPVVPEAPRTPARPTRPYSASEQARTELSPSDQLSLDRAIRGGEQKPGRGEAANVSFSPYNDLVSNNRQAVERLYSMDLNSPEAKATLDRLEAFAKRRKIDPVHVENLKNYIKNDQLGNAGLERRGVAPSEARQVEPTANLRQFYSESDTLPADASGRLSGRLPRIADTPRRPQPELAYKGDTGPLDTTQPERAASAPLGMENEISQTERDAISRRVSKLSPEQVDAALRDAEAARNEDVAKPQMGAMSRRLAGEYRKALNDRRKDLVSKKALPAKAKPSIEESIGMKWSRDPDYRDEARAFKEDFGRWPEDLAELQAGEPRQAKQDAKADAPTIQHERFGEVTVVEKAASGKLIVEDANGGTHTIKNPRTAGGNRSAAYAKKPLTEEPPMPVAEQMGKLSESAVGGKSEPLSTKANARVESPDSPTKIDTLTPPNRVEDLIKNGLNADIKLEWLLTKGATPDLFGARTIKDLFELPGGKEWWEKNGRPLEMKGKEPEIKGRDVEGIDPVNDPQGWRKFLRSIRDSKSSKSKSTPLPQNAMAARFTPGSKGRQGNLYLSPELFARIGSEGAGGTSVYKGNIRDFLSFGPDVLSKPERTMIESALREADSLGSDKIALTKASPRPLERTKTYSRHESIHGAQPLAVHQETLKGLIRQYRSRPKSETESKIIAALARGYDTSKPEEVLATEGPAYIASGDAAALGITEPQAEAFYNDYLDRIYQTGGFEPLMDLALRSRPTAKYAQMMAERLQWATENETAKNFPTTKPEIVAKAEARLKEIAAGRRAGSGAQALLDQAIVTGYKVYKAGMDFVQWSQAAVKDAGDTIRPHLRKAWESLQDDRQGAFDEARENQNERIGELGERQSAKGVRALELGGQRKGIEDARDVLREEAKANQAAGRPIPEGLRKSFQQKTAELQQLRKDEVRNTSLRDQAATEAEGLRAGQVEAAKGGRANELTQKRENLETERKAILADQSAMEKAGKPVPAALRKRLTSLDREIRQTRKDELKNRVLSGVKAGLKEFYTDEGGSALAGFNPPKPKKQQPAPAAPPNPPVPPGLARQRAIAQAKRAAAVPAAAGSPAAPRAAAPRPATPAAPRTPGVTPAARAPKAPQTAREYLEQQIAKSPYKQGSERVKDLANEEAKRVLDKAADRIARGKMNEKQQEAVLSASDDLMMAGQLGDQAAIKKSREALVRAMRNTDQQGLIKRSALAVARSPFKALRGAQSVVYGGDISFPLRQAAPMTLNPFNAFKTYQAIKSTYNAFGREDAGNFSLLPGSKGAEGVRKQLEAHPRYELGKQSGLELSLYTGPEEVYRDAGWTEKVPGLSMWMKRTQAANEAFLDTIRLGVFDKYVNVIEKNAKLTGKQRELAIQSAAEVINTMSGRTNLGQGKIKKGVELSNGILGAPQLAVSRAKLLDPTAIAREWNKSPDVGKQMLKDTVGFATGSLALMTLAAAVGGKVGWDPEDQDFGKIVIGDTVIDLFFGLTPMVKVAYVWGKAADAITTQASNPTEENEKAAQVARRDAIYRTGRFARGKLGPAASYLADLLWFGEDFEKNKVNLRSTVNPMDPNFAPYRLGVPLGISGAVKDAREEGSSAGKVAATTALEFFGASAYNKKARGEKIDRQSRFAQEAESQGFNMQDLKQSKGEPDAVFKARTGKANTWLTQFGEQLVNSADYQRATPDQKERALRSLKGRVMTEANQKSPNLGNFNPAAILRSVRRSEESRRKSRSSLIWAAPDEE